MPNPTVEKLYEGCKLAKENNIDLILAVGTGSEMNGGAVITNHETKLKIGHVFGENVFPKFSIMNPVYTFKKIKTSKLEFHSKIEVFIFYTSESLISRFFALFHHIFPYIQRFQHYSRF